MALPIGLKSVAKEALGWMAIAATLFGCVYFFTDIQALTRSVTGIDIEAAPVPRAVSPQETGNGFERIVHLKADENGHFYSEIYVNGRSIVAIVDTGATGVALSYEDAESLGIRPRDSDYTHLSQTANGTTRIAPVMLDEVRIGDIIVRDVQAFVGQPSALSQSLLGMTFLSRLTHVGIRGGELVLEQ